MSDVSTVFNAATGEGDWAAIPPVLPSPAPIFDENGDALLDEDGGALLDEAAPVFVGNDLLSGSDLETAALISLFTDRRADPSDVLPPGSTDRKGWWGDLGNQYPIGSRLWLLSRAKQIPQTLQDAEGYCAEALQWFLDDGVAAKIVTSCSFIGLGMMGISTTFYDHDGAVIASFQWAWTGLN